MCGDVIFWPRRVGLWSVKCWKWMWMCEMFGRGRQVPHISQTGTVAELLLQQLVVALWKLCWFCLILFNKSERRSAATTLPATQTAWKPEPIQARLCKWDMNDQNGALKRQKVSLLLKGHFKGRIEEDSVLKFTFTLLQKIPRNI